MVARQDLTEDRIQGSIDEAHLALLERAGLLDGAAAPELERWVEAVRWRTGSAVAAFVVSPSPTGPARLVTLARADGTGEAADEMAELVGRASLAQDLDPRRLVLDAPVRLDGQVVGAVRVADSSRRSWSDEDRRAVEDAAAAVATEVALRLARSEASRAQELLVSHAKVHDLIAGAAPLPDVLVAIVEAVERHDPDLLPCVVLLDPATNTLHPGAGPSLPDSYLDAIDGVVIGPNVGTCGSAAWSGQLQITEDVADDPKWALVRDVPLAAGLRHCWSMPIKAPTGEVLGTLAFYGRRARRPLPEHLGLLADWARVAGIALERHRALERLVRDARHDNLTGLANRMATMEALADALHHAAPSEQVGVLFVDLDGLKSLNDSLGHDRADEMLREVSDRLTATVPTGCLVGRLGGDEFVVVAERLASAADAGELGLRLLEAIAVPLPGLDALTITASIGIALASNATVEASELLREADSAMYTAKRSGRDRCAFYEGAQRIRGGRRAALGRALRGAEARGELRLDYEPVVDLDTRSIVGVEALPRWASPDHGEVSTDELLQVAEETGAVLPLGSFVLRESCETVARLSRAAGRQLELTLRLSPRQLENPGLVQSVRQVIVHSGLTTAMLALAVDEAGLVRPSAAVGRALQDLAALGIGVTLSNVGAALCALEPIKDLPLSAIKLDGHLVGSLPGDERSAAVVAALVGLSTSFGLEVAAGAVASPDVLARLAELGVRRGQGPAVHPPCDEAGLLALLSEPAA